MRRRLLSLLFLAALPLQAAAPEITAVLSLRKGLSRLMADMNRHPDLFPAATRPRPTLFQEDQKKKANDFWNFFWESISALEAIQRNHAHFWQSEKDARGPDFALHRAAFLAQYRFALDILTRLDREPAFEKILNQPDPDTGRPHGTYADAKFRFLNVFQGARFSSLQTLARTIRHTPLAGTTDDAAVLWKAGLGQGMFLTADNAAAILGHAVQKGWLPVQAGVAEWMGDTRVSPRRQGLISADQIKALPDRLKPGDILLERREWYLSNAGLPGYWPHAALYVGTPAERAAFFGAKAAAVEESLKAAHPAAHAQALQSDGGHPHRVLEAVSQGVVFTTLEHSADADALAVLRPRLPPEAVARALEQAFRFAGRPYDFDFNFITDDAFVCTELVFKAYQANISFPTEQLLGRPVMPANRLVQYFDETADRPDAPLDFVLFLDGDERANTAVERTAQDFRNSRKRPKWHILLTNTRPER